MPFNARVSGGASILLAICGGIVSCVGEDPVHTDPGLSLSDAAPADGQEAGVPVDAGGSYDADAATSTWCSGVDAAFCADFDSKAIEESGFTFRELTDGGAITRSPSDYRSAPFSAKLSIAPTSAGPGGTAWLRKIVPLPAGHASLRFRASVKITPFAAPQADSVATLLVFGTNGTAPILVERRSTGWSITLPVLGEGGTFATIPIRGELPIGVWFDLEALIRFGRNKGAILLRVNGTPIFDVSDVGTTTESVLTTTIVSIGPRAGAGPLPAIELRTDNFTMSTEP